MIIVDDLNRAFNAIIFGIKTETFRIMSFKEAIAFYYKYSLLPLILLIIMSYVLTGSILSVIPGFSGSSGVVIASLILVWIAVPLLMLIQTALIYVVGIIFKFFKNDLPKTFAAVTYGTIPLVLLLWLTSIPIYGKFILVAIEIWSFIILVIALSEQHEIGILKALVSAIIANIIISLLFYGALSLMLPHIRL